MDITTGKTTLIFFMLIISFCFSFLVFFFFSHKRCCRSSGRRDQSGKLFIRNIHLGQVTFPNENPIHIQPNSPSSLYLSDLNAMLLEVDGVGIHPNHSTNATSEESMNITIDYSTTDQPQLTEILTVVDASDLNQIKL
ncbi:uncharacterized protein [Palaemon carinicauda]|uniref:uncharacterized protein n=1 Tax=Palaemon carinicauda TaxID=392227 RepID=UPI0035B69A25